MKETGEALRKESALLRFYYKIDPGTLTDDEFCKLVGDMWYVLKFTNTLEFKK